MALLSGGGLALLSLGVLGVYLGWRHEPAFYRRALATPPETLERGSNELVEQATALVNNIHRQGDWQTLFTADQVNGWLAVDVPKNHPHLLPDGLSEPRVALDRGRIRIACRRGSGRLANVVALDLEPYLLGPNELAIRIRGARAGWLPLPLEPILKQITAAMIEAQWPLRWDQAGGNPVAVITLDARRNDDKLLSVEALEVHNGELFVAGVTKSGDWPSADPHLDRLTPPPPLEARLPRDDSSRER